MRKKILAVLMLILLIAGLSPIFSLSDDIPRKTKDELKSILGNPVLLVLDVRPNREYMFSDLKIKGADRPSGIAMGPGYTIGHIPPPNSLMTRTKSLFFISVHKMKK